MIKHWWVQRSKREQALLACLLTITLGLILHQTAWLPLQQHQARLQNDIAQQREKWQWLQQQHQSPDGKIKDISQQELHALLKELRKDATQIHTHIRTQAHDNTSTLTLSNIPYGTLLQHLSQWQQLGLSIYDLQLRPTGPQTLTANIAITAHTAPSKTAIQTN